MIDLSQDDLELVRRILRDHVPGIEVRAYGSRVRGNAERFSDLDLVLIGDRRFDWKTVEGLKDAFSISDLAIRVDVVDWNAISPEFRAAIAANSEVLVASAERDRTP
jgi:predicted nucleotidyltransferase